MGPLANEPVAFLIDMSASTDEEINKREKKYDEVLGIHIIGAHVTGHDQHAVPA